MGKKLTMTILGTIICAALAAAGLYFKVDTTLVTQIVVIVGGLFGLSVGGHLVTDVASILKGAQDAAPVAKDIVQIAKTGTDKVA